MCFGATESKQTVQQIPSPPSEEETALRRAAVQSVTARNQMIPFLLRDIGLETTPEGGLREGPQDALQGQIRALSSQSLSGAGEAGNMLLSRLRNSQSMIPGLLNSVRASMAPGTGGSFMPDAGGFGQPPGSPMGGGAQPQGFPGQPSPLPSPAFSGQPQMPPLPSGGGASSGIGTALTGAGAIGAIPVIKSLLAGSTAGPGVLGASPVIGANAPLTGELPFAGGGVGGGTPPLPPGGIGGIGAAGAGAGAAGGGAFAPGVAGSIAPELTTGAGAIGVTAPATGGVQGIGDFLPSWLGGTGTALGAASAFAAPIALALSQIIPTIGGGVEAKSQEARRRDMADMIAAWEQATGQASGFHTIRGEGEIGRGGTTIDIGERSTGGELPLGGRGDPGRPLPKGSPLLTAEGTPVFTGRLAEYMNNPNVTDDQLWQELTAPFPSLQGQPWQTAIQGGNNRAWQTARSIFDYVRSLRSPNDPNAYFQQFAGIGGNANSNLLR